MMERTGQRRRWRAVCASVAILCGALLASAPAAAHDAAALPEILTLEEAADFLRVDPLVLKDMAHRQEVPGRRIGVTWRFSRSALRAWLAGAEVGTAELFGAPPEISGTVGQDGAEAAGSSGPANSRSEEHSWRMKTWTFG